MKSIHPCLWFTGQLDDAIAFYQSVFPDTRVDYVNPGPDGKAFTAEWVIQGQRFMGLNGGGAFSFNEAISFVVSCEGQAEVDYLWDRLAGDGGEESMCGWLKDRFGVSWQIVPTRLGELLGGPDPEGAQRATQAMLQMHKIDIAALERAYAGH
jgi:predicted 3-demethylubiquinone-9 3-methyltransferase (glyoxalase superfamily)